MGCNTSHSKQKENSDKNEADESKMNVQDTNREKSFVFDPDQYDQNVIKQLKEGFKNDTEIFILNQMLMCTMFFFDYSDDIRKCAAITPENKTLIKEHQKELIVPDTVLKSVCQNLKYIPLEGPCRNQNLPLISQRMYVIHNNIEVEEQSSNPANYAIIDKPCHQAKIEESKDHKGFVRVNMLLPNETRSSFDSVYTESSEEKPGNTVNTREVPSTSGGIMHNDSGFNTESDYEYASITAANTPQKLNVITADIYTSNCQLPSKCITPVRTKNIVSDTESEDEEDRSSNTPIQAPSLFLVNNYLNSREFMILFRDNVFPNYLGQIINFPIPFIQRATATSASIFCNNVDDEGNIVNYEIIPAISISWPDQIAFEWPLRPRPEVYDLRNNTKYEWPTIKMISEAKLLKCVLMPRGYMPKRGSNPKMEIEWEIGFPKAERYLELRMSHPQMRIFLFILMLHKKFIEPNTKRYGLLLEHIRHLMFWECETNYKDWPQDRLGLKLLQVLKNLYNYLSKRELPHYFIKQRNLFENVPNKYVFQTLDVINRVKESPVIYMLTALKDIKYNAPATFYPETDLDELYRIISADTVYDNVNIQASIMSYEEVKKKEMKNNENKKPNKEHEWNRRYMEAKRQKNVLKYMKKGVEIKEQNKTISTELKLTIQKRFQGDTVRQIQLLTFFINHFVKIAKRSLKVSSSNQTLFYLKQAWYLTKLLEETDIDNALTLQKQIKEVEDNCQKRRVTEPKIPQTPRRNTFNNSEVIQVKGKSINIANLSKAYNEKKSKSTPGIKMKGKPKLEPHVKVNPVETKHESEDDQLREKLTTPSVSIEKSQKTATFLEAIDSKSDEIEFTSL